MKPEQCRLLIKEKLGEELYRHSLGVAEMAASLAERYGYDLQKAYLAGLVHDYGKGFEKSELLQKAKVIGLPLDRIMRQEKRLLHAPVGAALIERELGINDPDIISSVAHHTTGRSGMSLLEKIVYLADYIETGRDFEEIDRIRALAFENIDQALLKVLEQTIRSVLKRGLLLHPRSIAFRNNLIMASEKRISE